MKCNVSQRTLSITQTILSEVSFSSLKQRTDSVLIKTAVGGMDVLMSYSYSIAMRTDQMMITEF